MFQSTDTLNIDMEKNNTAVPITEFSRSSIEDNKEFIELVDTDEEKKLDMFCYIKCNENDSELIKQCRGVVFHDQTLVMKAFPYTLEYNEKQQLEIDKVLVEFQDWSFYKAHEGALLRVFNFDGKWFTSTHRKLNAFKSKWSSKESFGTSFQNALLCEEENNAVFKSKLPVDGDSILQRFQSTLDVTKQYMFLICNNSDNRIVCDAPDKPTVYHVGTFINNVLCMKDDVGISKPEKISILNIDELLLFVKFIDYKNYQGVIAFDSNNKQLKILNSEYQHLFSIRGNEPSIKFRYLQIRMDARSMDILFLLYPNMMDSFDEYENILFDIACSIHKSYVERFIKKNYVIVPGDEYKIIKECHSLYMSNRKENGISIETVIRTMNKQTPTHLNHMIRNYKLSRRVKVEVTGTVHSETVHSETVHSGTVHSGTVHSGTVHSGTVHSGTVHYETHFEDSEITLYTPKSI